MSKIKFLFDVVESLRSLAESVQDVAEAMTEVETTNITENTVTETKVEETKPAVTMEQVRAVLAAKSRDKGNEAVRGLLQKYGANKLSAIDPKDYLALLADAEVL